MNATVALSSNQTLVIRNSDLISTEMDGDTVMMSIERGEYFGLGGVGTRAWALLAQPTCVDAMAQTICNEFEVDLPTATADLQKFVQDLLDHSLVALA